MNIVVGVSGSIAAYKAVDFVNQLHKSHHNVRVVMTKNATAFVTPLTFEAISHNKCIVDMFAHVLERYFTNTTEVGLTDGLCESVMRTIVYEAGRVMEDPASYDARANLMWAGTIAHNNILGAGREQDWGSHLIEHELSAKYGCAHGAGLAVVFPAWMKYVVRHDPARFARWAVNVWGCEERENVMDTAMDGIGRYEAFLSSLGMPRTLGDVGGKAEDIPELAVNVGFGPYQFGNFVKLGIPETTEILKLAL